MTYSYHCEVFPTEKGEYDVMIRALSISAHGVHVLDALNEAKANIVFGLFSYISGKKEIPKPKFEGKCFGSKNYMLEVDIDELRRLLEQGIDLRNISRSYDYNYAVKEYEIK